VFDRAIAQYPEERIFLTADKGNSLSFMPSATGATNPMHVVFGHIGQFKVDYVRKLLDI
jgi:hypothetical protein